MAGGVGPGVLISSSNSQIWGSVLIGNPNISVIKMRAISSLCVLLLYSSKSTDNKVGKYTTLLIHNAKPFPKKHLRGLLQLQPSHFF